MTESLMLWGMLILLAALAWLVVLTDKLFTAVVYAGLLSAAAALCYLLLGAPDVALAEVVIGSTLSTIIYLVTLRKYRLFTLYVRVGALEGGRINRLLSLISRALEEQEIEPHILQSAEPAEQLLARPGCDLVVEEEAGWLIVHGEASSRYLRAIGEKLEGAGMRAQVELRDSLPESVAAYKGSDA